MFHLNVAERVEVIHVLLKNNNRQIKIRRENGAGPVKFLFSPDMMFLIMIYEH